MCWHRAITFRYVWFAFNADEAGGRSRGVITKSKIGRRQMRARLRPGVYEKLNDPLQEKQEKHDALAD